MIVGAKRHYQELVRRGCSSRQATTTHLAVVHHGWKTISSRFDNGVIAHVCTETGHQRPPLIQGHLAIRDHQPVRHAMPQPAATPSHGIMRRKKGKRGNGELPCASSHDEAHASHIGACSCTGILSPAWTTDAKGRFFGFPATLVDATPDANTRRLDCL